MNAVVTPVASLALPVNIDAEQALIGCAIYDNRAFGGLDETLKPEHFFEPFHQRVWAAMAERASAGRSVELPWLLECFATDPAFQGLGAAYFAQLIDVAPPAASAATLAETIISTHRRRQVIELGEEMCFEARQGDTSPYDVICEAERRLSRLVQDAAPPSVNMIDARSSVLSTLGEIRQEAQQGRSKGYMTGLRCFDRRLRGLRPGWLVVVAGRPSMGKTALARAAALGAAQRTKDQVVFFALEMARRELDERTLSQLSHQAGEGIAYKDMNGDTLPPEDLSYLDKLAQRVPTNFIIDDSPVLSVSYVRRRVLALKRRAPVAAVFIDYLQIMDRPDAKGRNEASVIGEMTKSLKQLAREAQTCVVLLSQINRGVESRDDKRPQLSDLRESGAIEQDANAVLFPYREVYYLERSEPKDPNKRTDWEMACAEAHRKMDVIAAKVRQGAVGTDHQTYFAEYDHIEDAPEEKR